MSFVCLFYLFYFTRACTNRTLFCSLQPNDGDDTSRVWPSFKSWIICRRYVKSELARQIFLRVPVVALSLTHTLFLYPFHKKLFFFLPASNSLTGTFPQQINSWVNLEVLDLGSNGYSGQLPSEIGLLTRLTALHLCTSTIPHSNHTCPSKSQKRGTHLVRFLLNRE